MEEEALDCCLWELAVGETVCTCNKTYRGMKESGIRSKVKCQVAV